MLVNNAGITRDMTFKKMDKVNWHAVMSTNLDSTFNMTKQVCDGMLDRGWGRIINISSVNGQKGAFGKTNYRRPRPACMASPRRWRWRWREGRDRQHHLAGLHRHQDGDGDPGRARQQDHPADPDAAVSAPEDIARSGRRILASEEAAFMTGANIAINGGQRQIDRGDHRVAAPAVFQRNIRRRRLRLLACDNPSPGAVNAAPVSFQSITYAMPVAAKHPPLVLIPRQPHVWRCADGGALQPLL